MYCIKGRTSLLANSINIAEYNTATPSATITVPYTGQYYLVVVGGGGGSTQTGYEKYYRGAGGGSGACFAGIVSLEAGDYTITVGAGGHEHYRDNVSGADGGGTTTFANSTGTVLVSAGGGTGGRVSYSTIYEGSGGVLSLSDELNVIETSISSNGNKGQRGSRYQGWTIVYGGESLYKSYGAAGITTPTSRNAFGQDGCVILSVVQKPFKSPVMTSNGTLGGDSFAIAGNTGSSTIYSITTPSGYSMNGAEHMRILTFYNPLPMQINKVTWSNATAHGSVVSSIKGWGVYESDDNIDWKHIGDYYSVNAGVSQWTQINFPSTNSRYFRLVWLGAIGSNGGYSNGHNLTLHGTVTSITVPDNNLVTVPITYCKTVPKYYKKVDADWQECTQEEYFTQEEENRKIRYNYYVIK